MSLTRFEVRVDTPAAVLALDKARVRKVMRAAGAEVLAAAKAAMRASGGGKAARRLAGGRRASRPGEAPAVASGALLRSLRLKPSKDGLGVIIRASEFYALFLEAGAQGGGGVKGQRNRYNSRTRQRLSLVGRRVLAPRPFLSTALDSRAASLTQRIAAAVDTGVTFKRIK